MTCAGYPGSKGHEVQDARLLASWGVDYWKFDNCYTDCNGASVYPQTCWNSRTNTSTWYTPMKNALSGAGRPIFFSLCQWGLDRVWEWGAGYGNSWRMSGDIQNNWNSVASIAASAAGMSQYAAPGGFNDLDMMVSVVSPDSLSVIGSQC
jgi:alpha-galactosidase